MGNWVTSSDWPGNESGQCIVGGIYGSSATKSNTILRNIYVETAASCAIGLQIDKNAYSRHLTTEHQCVGSIQNIEIDGMFFDEEFYAGNNYGNYLGGESNPNKKCTGDLSGRIDGFKIKANVAGRALTKEDFVEIDGNTVSGVTFSKLPPTDSIMQPAYTTYKKRNTYENAGAAIEIDKDGVQVLNEEQCKNRCSQDLSCDCVTYDPAKQTCWKRHLCNSDQFDVDKNYNVYLRQWNNEVSMPKPKKKPKKKKKKKKKKKSKKKKKKKKDD